MEKDFELVFREKRIYKAVFENVALSSENPEDDYYDKITYYDGGEIKEDEGKLIYYDGGGVKEYGDSEKN